MDLDTGNTRVEWDSLVPVTHDKVPATRSVEGWIIIVTNLHEEVTEEDLTELFEDFGEVVNVKLNLDGRTGYVKGYALVEYKTQGEAARAVEGVHQLEYLGRVLECDFCFVESPRYGKKGNERRNNNMVSRIDRERSRSPYR